MEWPIATRSLLTSLIVETTEKIVEQIIKRALHLRALHLWSLGTNFWFYVFDFGFNILI